MSWKNFLFASYWFSQPAGARGGTFIFFVVLFLALSVGGVLFLLWRRQLVALSEQKFYGRVSALLLTLGLSGLVWLYFRQERVWFLAWRAWLLALVIVGVLWGAALIRYYFFRRPQIRAEQAARALKEKYLPRKN